MSRRLVLSIFPGLDALGMGFEAEGYCVVRGPDVLWGGDIRQFEPPDGVFDGVIGGDPCQAHSRLTNLVRAKGLEPRFGDLTAEYQRIVETARPRWFLRENVVDAPDMKPLGYDVRSFVLDHSTMDRGDGTGHEQMRRRRFWFGCAGLRGEACPELRAHIDFALFVLPEGSTAVCAGHGGGDPENPKFRGLQMRYGQRTLAVCGDPRLPGGQAEVDALKRGDIAKVERKASVTGRHTSRGMGGDPETTPGNHPGNPPRYNLQEMLSLQGLPETLFDHSPFTMEGKRRLIGNAVPLGMARALAGAIRKAMG